MTRRLLNLMTALSLSLALAVVALWVRSRLRERKGDKYRFRRFHFGQPHQQPPDIDAAVRPNGG